MINWIKHKLGISVLESRVDYLEGEVKLLEERVLRYKQYVDNHIKELERYTAVDADISRSGSSIILTGVYKGKGYVRFYDLSQEDFIHFVETVKWMTKEKALRVVDKPYWFNGSFEL